MNQKAWHVTDTTSVSDLATLDAADNGRSALAGSGMEPRRVHGRLSAQGMVAIAIGTVVPLGAAALAATGAMSRGVALAVVLAGSCIAASMLAHSMSQRASR